METSANTYDSDDTFLLVRGPTANISNSRKGDVCGTCLSGSRANVPFLSPGIASKKSFKGYNAGRAENIQIVLRSGWGIVSTLANYSATFKSIRLPFDGKLFKMASQCALFIFSCTVYFHHGRRKVFFSVRLGFAQSRIFVSSKFRSVQSPETIGEIL